MKHDTLLQWRRLMMILIAIVCNTYEGFSWIPTTDAFYFSGNHHTGSIRQPLPHSHYQHRHRPQSLPTYKSKSTIQRSGRSSRTALALGDDWWNTFRGIFQDLTGNNNKNDGNGDNDADEETAAGTFSIASIPVQSLKPGGLRLFLMFYLMGAQNTPDQGSWKAHQPDSPPSPMEAYSSSTPTTSFNLEENDDVSTAQTNEFDTTYVLEMFYKDASAMVSIELLPHEVKIQRCGSLPSTAYLMQETVLLEGILDELERCAFDKSVDEANRLILLSSPDGIDNALSTLSFA